MTQLARPDLARDRSGQDHARPGPARAKAEALRAGRSGLLRAGRPVPGWTVSTALLAPVVLVGGWLIADALQPASYSPMRETMSVLAGYSGTDRWVMTAALLVVGSCQVATGAGLTAVSMPARILLILTGLSTLGIAATPEPATGPTLRHLAFAVSCVVTTGVWPVLVARRSPARSWILSFCGCATVTAVFAGLSCWLLMAARDGGGDLGMVERLTSAVQGLFPLVVALALRQTARGAGSRGRRGQDRSRTRQAVAPLGRRTVPSGRTDQSSNRTKAAARAPLTPPARLQPDRATQHPVGLPGAAERSPEATRTCSATTFPVAAMITSSRPSMRSRTLLPISRTATE